EFLPFRDVLGRLGLRKLTEGSVDFLPGEGRRTLRLAGLPPASALICYEAAFPAEATDPGDRPAWIVNITNDAWFGRSSGPDQQLAMAPVGAVAGGGARGPVRPIPGSPACPTPMAGWASASA